MKLVSFVIPCYCSANTIGSVVDEIEGAMAQLPQYGYEIILVNDSSPDSTFSVLAALAEKDGRITAVDLARNFGQHGALMAGFHHCTGDIIVCLDDDGQTPADEVGKLLSKLEEGYDVVYASYEHKQHSRFRNLGSKFNGLMTEIMLGKPKGLTLTSYFVMRRFVLNDILRYNNCYPYIDGLVLRSSSRYATVPVNHRQRQEGHSGYTLSKLLNLWMNGFTSFSIKPLRLATYMGCLAAFAGFIYAIIIVIRYFTIHLAPLGWSSTTALLLILGGIILLVLGLVGEYVGRIFMCVNASPQYVERKVIKYGREE